MKDISLGGSTTCMQESLEARNICHKARWKSKSVKDKHTLDAANKEVYTAVLAAKELQEFTADLRSESGRKNCFRIAREGRDVISVCCMKKNVVSDADGMNNIWRSI